MTERHIVVSYEPGSNNIRVLPPDRDQRAGDAAALAEAADMLKPDRSHVCVDRCRPNAHIAFEGRRAADEAEAAGRTIPSRSTDPDTSRKAEPGPMRAGSQRARLLAAFARPEAVDGLTDEEAADLADGVPYRSEFAKRCSELRAAGLIEPTGSTRPGVAGHERIVSRITDGGQAVADAMRREVEAVAWVDSQHGDAPEPEDEP